MLDLRCQRRYSGSELKFESAATNHAGYGQDYRSGAGWVGGSVAVRAAGRGCGVVRDAPDPVDSGAPDFGFRGTGVLEFAEVG